MCVYPLHRLPGLLVSRAFNLACSHVLGFLREKINRDGWRKTAAIICFFAACSECRVHCRNARNWGTSRVNLQPPPGNVMPVERSMGNTCADSPPSFSCETMGFCSCQPPAPGLFSHLWSFNFFILTKSHLLSLNLFLAVVAIPISNLFLASQSDVLHQILAV